MWIGIKLIFISVSHLKHHHEEDPQATAVQRQSNQALCVEQRAHYTHLSPSLEFLFLHSIDLFVSNKHQ